MMEPLRVRAWLRSPVVSDVALPLDGMLLYQAARRRYGPKESNYPGVALYDGAADVKLPIKRRHGPRSCWYYLCSWAQWPEHVVDGRSFWTKRLSRHTEILDLGRAKQVSLKGGRYRSYQMPVFYRSCLYVDWYCVGDGDAILDLLSDVWGLGKKTTQGYGRVLRWEAEPIIGDWSVWRNGDLARAVPVCDQSYKELDESWPKMEVGFRPSYWQSHNQAMCYIPRACAR